MYENYPSVSALYHEGSCTFTVWAPCQKKIALLFGNKTYALQSNERGYWQTTLTGVEPGGYYQFLIDHNDQPLPDPASRRQPEGVYGPSAIVDPFFPWTDDDWKGIPLENMIIYELHTGTFTAQGNFSGILTKLPYLQQLGINTIELMPVAAFPGTRNWGYDGVFPFAVHEGYGGAQGLKVLVNEAHQHGIAVILDVVFNHLGPEGNILPAFAPFFTDKYKTPWGSAINFDDAYSYGVRAFYWQNAMMWLDEFHLDGLRLDAVHAIWDSGALHFIQALKEKVAALEMRTGRKKVLIAEFDLNNPRYITPIAQGGYGFDGQWIDEFHHALHAVITGETNGYYEDFGKVEQLAKSFRDSYVYTGEYSVHRKKHFGVPPVNTSYGQFVVFAQNHDQVGNRLFGDRLSTQLPFEALKLAAATVLLSPHVPLLFMGEEYGEKNPFQFFVHHQDEKLVELTRKGRKEEFAYFNWEGDIPDPQSEETYRQCILSWNYENDEAAACLLKFYQHLIEFRKERAAMQRQERNTVQVWHEPGSQVIAISRTNGNEQLILFFNYSTQQEQLPQPLPVNLQKIFDSAGKNWRGPGAISADTLAPGETVVLLPHSVVIYETKQ